MTVDYAIVGIYLSAVVYLGLAASRGVKSLRDYTVSTERYGILALTATLCSSFIGGGFSSGNAANCARLGIGNIVSLFGFSISVILVGRLVAPRLERFKSAITVGEIIRMAYGKPAQITSGFFSLLVCAGILGAQISAMGYMFDVFLGTGLHFGIITGCAIVLLYSTLGGIRAIVANDVLQFLVLGFGVPMLLFFSFKEAGGASVVFSQTPPEFYDIFNGRGIVGLLSMFFSLALGEALVPPFVQRMLMGKSLKTTSRSVMLSGLLSIPFFVITGLVGIAGSVYFAGQSIDMNSIMQLMIKQAAPVGLRGLLVAGMLSIVMGSADSFLNSASAGFVNDLLLPLSRGRLSERAALLSARGTNIVTGTLAVAAAIAIPNVLDVLTFSYSFWSPVVLVPLAAALLGFKTRPRSFFVGVAAGIFATLFWRFALSSPLDIDCAVVGFTANLAAFSLSNISSRRSQRTKKRTCRPATTPLH
ncbi:MAG: sodium:solute symporter family protein [Oscillospiraceae bacterium]